MQKINWGIIGCGDVTEVKSGPAFSKVNNSSLVAVMRRDIAKAEDYAKRHYVPKWYGNAYELINDPSINAVYVATPPSSHEEYTIAALQAGKPVYVEKPMSANASSAKKMLDAANETNVKLVVAHYRRAQPFFRKIKELLDEKVIGDVRFSKLECYKKNLSKEELAVPKTAWRVDAAIAGGGLFHDLAPHQVDIANFFFGEIASAYGASANQSKTYSADDIVIGNIVYKNGVLFSGTWCFSVADDEEKDSFEIYGSAGKMSFSIFGEHLISLTKNNKTEVISFDIPKHVQQPMIEKVVAYFLDKGANPCSAQEGVNAMQLIDIFTH